MAHRGLIQVNWLDQEVNILANLPSLLVRLMTRWRTTRSWLEMRNPRVRLMFYLERRWQGTRVKESNLNKIRPEIIVKLLLLTIWKLKSRSLIFLKIRS